MKVHELKSWPGVFQAVKRGEKRHEIRVNDRDFKTGDVVVLNEWNPERFSTGMEIGYTGSEPLRFVIGHISRGTFGLPENLCVFTLQPEAK